jgi:hypothetical protein
MKPFASRTDSVKVDFCESGTTFGAPRAAGTAFGDSFTDNANATGIPFPLAAFDFDPGAALAMLQLPSCFPTDFSSADATFFFSVPSNGDLGAITPCSHVADPEPA